jgi:Flp pilus assembly protein TadD
MFKASRTLAKKNLKKEKVEATGIVTNVRGVGGEMDFFGAAEQQQPGSGAAFVGAAHSLGMRAFADPANSEADWKFFASLGVDAIYSTIPMGVKLQRAIELNPNDPTAHEWYCHLLIVRGQFTEALTEARHARDLDPVNPLFHAVLAETYYYSRAYDSSIEEAQQLVKLHPDFQTALFWLGSALREKKMYPQAIATFQRARELSHDLPFLVMAYGHAQALSGNVAEAQKAIRILKQSQRSKYVPDLYVAAVYVGLGDKGEALRHLDLAYDQKVDRLVYLNVEPLADPLRSDPRFAQLLKKIGIQ